MSLFDKNEANRWLNMFRRNLYDSSNSNLFRIFDIILSMRVGRPSTVSRNVTRKIFRINVRTGNVYRSRYVTLKSYRGIAKGQERGGEEAGERPEKRGSVATDSEVSSWNRERERPRRQRWTLPVRKTFLLRSACMYNVAIRIGIDSRERAHSRKLSRGGRNARLAIVRNSVLLSLRTLVHEFWESRTIVSI